MIFLQKRKQKIAIIARGPLASGLLGGEFNTNTKFAENDHRNYNIKGEAFDIGDTFSGIDFSKGLKAVDELKKILPKGLFNVTVSTKMDFNARCCNCSHSRCNKFNSS